MCRKGYHHRLHRFFRRDGLRTGWCSGKPNGSPGVSIFARITQCHRIYIYVGLELEENASGCLFLSPGRIRLARCHDKAAMLEHLYNDAGTTCKGPR